MFMTDQQSAELAEPSVGSLHDPAADIAPQFASVLVSAALVVLPVGHNQIDAALLHAFPQRIGVVSPVGDYALGFLPRTPSRPWDADFSERGFHKRSFTRRGTFQTNSQRKTLTVDPYHIHFVPLPRLVLPTAEPPFSPGRSCHPGWSHPTSAAPLHPGHRAGHARLPARRLPPATAVTDANKSRARETRRAEIATPHRFAEPTVCPPSRLDSGLVAVLAYRAAA